MVVPSLIVIYFTLYSFFGWVHEMIFSAVVHQRLHLQGFLALPLLPIYGFGALGILAATSPYADNPVMVFFSAVVVATLLELITSTFLLKAFNLRLWDYTKWPLNYKGKVSVLSSLGFGVLGLFLLYVVQPFMQHLVGYGCVDPHPHALGLKQFQGIGQFSARRVRNGDERRIAGGKQPGHAAGIVAVRPNAFAVVLKLNTEALDSL